MDPNKHKHFSTEIVVQKLNKNLTTHVLIIALHFKNSEENIL